MIKVWKLGMISYDTALKIQMALARRQLDAVKRGLDENLDTILLVEHKPVFTVGLRDTTSVDEIGRLKKLGAEFKKTNRGGLITFHGPGQLVVYPIINLKNYKTSVKWYVNSLEETVLNVCNELGVKGMRSPHTGVWVEDNKIASIGIHASRYITTHGLSINCNNDLSWFDNIDPCGIEDKGVTSFTKETGVVWTTEKLTPIFLKCFGSVLDCKFEDIDVATQEEILNSVYNNILIDKNSFTEEKQNTVLVSN